MILCTESYFKIDLYRSHILPNVIELLEIYCALDSLERRFLSKQARFLKVMCVSHQMFHLCFNWCNLKEKDNVTVGRFLDLW